MTSAARRPALQAPALAAEALQRCAHCGLPVAARDVTGAAPFFCCAGCRTVYEIVHAAGLSGYYSYQDRSAAVPVRARAAFKYQELDDPGFQAQHCRAGANGEVSIELVLEGVHCSDC